MKLRLPDCVFRRNGDGRHGFRKGKIPEQDARAPCEFFRQFFVERQDCNVICNNLNRGGARGRIIPGPGIMRHRGCTGRPHARPRKCVRNVCRHGAKSAAGEEDGGWSAQARTRRPCLRTGLRHVCGATWRGERFVHEDGAPLHGAEERTEVPRLCTSCSRLVCSCSPPSMR